MHIALILLLLFAFPTWAAEPAARGTAAFGQVTCDTTSGGVLVKAANVTRHRIILVQNATVDVFIGFDNTVTTSNGVLLTGTKGAQLVLKTIASIRCISASSGTISFYEENNLF